MRPDIGFQVGEGLKLGLIHNAMANVFLCQTGLSALELLGDEWLERVRHAFLRNAANRSRPDAKGTGNPRYARIWPKLPSWGPFGDRRCFDELPEDIDFVLSYFHVAGVPDTESEATLRETGASMPRTSSPWRAARTSLASAATWAGSAVTVPFLRTFRFRVPPGFSRRTTGSRPSTPEAVRPTCGASPPEP